MTSLIDKIEMLIKREKTTPERKKKDDSTKSSSEILSELFGAFNAAPPKIDEKISSKKSKKSKKKHKKDKKKRSRSSSSSSSQSDSDYSHKHKKRKKNKKKSRDDRSPSRSRSKISPNIKLTPELKVKPEPIKFKHDPGKIKTEDDIIDIKKELKKEPVRRASIKIEDSSESKSVLTEIDTSLIPMPDSPKLETEDLRHKLDGKRTEVESDKAKGKIQIKNLKFSAVFEETVKKAEEEARKKKEKYEEGEVTDSSSSSEKDRTPNAQFPKMSDPGGIMKRNAEEIKVPEEDKISSKRTKHSDSSRSKKDRGRSRSRSRRRSRSSSRRYHRSSSRSRHGGIRTHSRSRRRSRSRSRGKARYPSPKHRDRGRRSWSRDAGVKLADSEKKRLLEVARRNAINMLKNGAVPAGAAALPPHTRNQVMAAIQSGGKSVDELTDFCKHLSKKEALGELSSASSDDNMSENEDTLAFHHPFLVKEKAPIVMNIRGGAPLPIKSSLAVANKDELRLQFPVSSGTQHRDTEWVPVSPKKDNMQVAKLSSSKPPSKSSAPTASVSEKPTPTTTAPLPLPPPPEPPAYMKSFISNASQLSTVPSLPVPGPQAYPPGVEPPKIDLAAIVSQKLLMIRKEQEQNEVSTSRGLGFSSKSSTLGQFTGSTGAQILTPRELASGTQAWAKKDQLVRAAPVQGGMGALLLQKMGWTPGRGLGKEGTGTLQPLMLEVKLDTRGLSAKEEVGGRGKGMKMQRMPKRSVPALPLASGGKHPVSLLGEYCSKNKLGPPEYTLCFECGPDHKKNFLFKVKVATTEYQPAVASANKKQAKADSAQLALQKLGIL